MLSNHSLFLSGVGGGGCSKLWVAYASRVCLCILVHVNHLPIPPPLLDFSLFLYVIPIDDVNMAQKNIYRHGDTHNNDDDDDDCWILCPTLCVGHIQRVNTWHNMVCGAVFLFVALDSGLPSALEAASVRPCRRVHHALAGTTVLASRLRRATQTTNSPTHFAQSICPPTSESGRYLCAS